MPIVDLQRNAREIGRIRLGEFVKPSSSGKGRPSKLSTYRFTSQSRELMDKVATLYGGTVVEWTPQGGGAQAWEVVTESTRIPILLPPNPLSQWYETWAGGGCQRRCDGNREVLTDQACICGPDPDDRTCKPTTRLNVMLRDVEALGVFRLETHGYYAATELPGIAQFLLIAPQEYVAAYLILEWRRVKRDGKTREFAVPGLEVEGMTPAQLMSGGVASAPALTAGGNSAIEAKWDPDSILTAVAAAQNKEDLREMWRRLREDNALTPQIGEAISARVAELVDEAPAPVEESVDAFDGLSEEQEVYYRLMSAVDPSLSSKDVEAAYKTWSDGGDLNTASAEEMQRYIDHLEENG